MLASAIRVTSSDHPDSYDVARGDACLGTTERLLPILGSVPRDTPQPFSLDGNVARRRHIITPARAVLWDGVLPGFGLRVRRGHKNGSWVVRVRFRTTDKLVTLGHSVDMDADTAREIARRRLAAVALDGLPRRTAVRAVPTFGKYVDEFLRDYARHWKPRTARTSRAAIYRHFVPVFGEMPLDTIGKADVLRWRDSITENGEGSFNRTITILSAMLKYAEQLGYRKRGSNPCRGIPRFKRVLPERYLTAAEYRRLAGVLAEDDERSPLDVAMIRLLIYAGARVGEIAGLRLEWVQPGRLMLPDSKTGQRSSTSIRRPKRSWRACRAVRAAILSSRDSLPTVRARSTHTGSTRAAGRRCQMSGFTISAIASLRPRSCTAFRSRRSASCSGMRCPRAQRVTRTLPTR